VARGQMGGVGGAGVRGVDQLGMSFDWSVRQLVGSR
jgi:hypothetical protein